MIGQHMHLIDEVYLKAPPARSILHIIEELAGIFDLCSRSRIDLYQVDESPLVNLHARVTLSTGNRTNPFLAIQTFCQYSSEGGFSHSTRTGEEIRMMQALIIQSIDQ